MPDWSSNRHFMEYFGVWAIEEQQFLSAIKHVESMDLDAHMREPRMGDGVSSPLMVSDGVAVIEITGPMLKFGSSLSEGGSTVRARREIRNAMNDDSVSAIVLKIDSPGGTVAGTFDLVDDIRIAGLSKPVHAFIEDLGASAAFAVASAATKVFATPTSLVGSIGTFTVIRDVSVAAAQAGIKVHVIRSGEFKGAGVPGTEVTPEQLTDIQRTVDSLNEHFLDSVAAGRRMSRAQVELLADGRVHIASDALALGLIDGIQSFDETLTQLTKATQKEARMSTELDAVVAELAESRPQAATPTEIRNGCPGADQDAQFVLDQIDRNATLQQAKDAWMSKLAAKVEAKAAADKEAAEQAKAAADNETGVEALGGGNPNKKSQASGFGGSAREELFSIAKEYEGRGMPRQKAMARAVRENKELHAEMLREANEGRDD